MSNEALARIEHKLDLILESLAQNLPYTNLRSVGDPNHQCPLCMYPVEYVIDVVNNVLNRRCGCETGMQPSINLQPFAPPSPTKAEGTDNDD